MIDTKTFTPNSLIKLKINAIPTFIRDYTHSNQIHLKFQIDNVDKIGKLRFLSDDPVTSVPYKFIVNEDFLSLYDDENQEVSRYADSTGVSLVDKIKLRYTTISGDFESVL